MTRKYWRDGNKYSSTNQRFSIKVQKKQLIKLDKLWRRRGVVSIKCHCKICYGTYLEALIDADEYNSRMGYIEYPMTPYFCSIHDCWHKGHDRRLSKLEVVLYVALSARRHRNRNCQNFRASVQVI